jgi:hypothetical protein
VVESRGARFIGTLRLLQRPKYLCRCMIFDRGLHIASTEVVNSDTRTKWPKEYSEERLAEKHMEIEGRGGLISANFLAA